MQIWVKFNQQIIIKFCATHNTIQVKWEVNFLQDFIH